MPENSQNICQKCGRPLTLNPDSGDFECVDCKSVVDADAGGFKDPQDAFAEQVLRMQQEMQSQLQEKLQEDPRYKQARKVNSFYENLNENTPKAYITYLLLAVNVIIFGICLVKAGPAGVHSRKFAEVLYDLGGNFGLLTMNGEEWRLITSMFLHGGYAHIMLNMYALFAIGLIVEKIFGNMTYLAIYFFTGIAGSLASNFNNPEVLGVGASGAICGIFGAFLGFVFIQRKNLPPKFAKDVARNALIIIVLNGIIGVTIPNIDNAAHLGGLVSGFIAAFLVNIDINKVTAEKRRAKLVLFIIIGAVLIFSFGKITKENVRNNIDSVESREKKSEALLTQIQEAENIIDLRLKNLLAASSNDTQLKSNAKEMAEEIIPIWRSKFNDKINLMINDPDYKKPPVSYQKYLQKYSSLMGESLIEYKKFFETGDEKYLDSALKIKKQYKALKPEDFN